MTSSIPPAGAEPFDPPTAGARVVQFCAGTVLFRAGAPGDDAYLITDGEVEVTRMQDGERHVLASLTRGDVVGEMSLIGAGVRTADAMARGHTVAIRISRREFESIAAQSHPVLRRMLEILSGRLRERER